MNRTDTERFSGLTLKLFNLCLTKPRAPNIMATGINVICCIGLAVVLTGVGKSAFIGKSHSGGKDDPVLQYVVNNSLREHPVLTKLRLRTLEDPWNIMMVASEQAQFMANLIRLINATNAIEIGMYTGYNALSMALAMSENGRVVACEIEDTYVDIAKPFFKEAGVENKIDVRHQIAMKTLNELIAAGGAGAYDFVFIDADKFNYDRYYEKSLELIRPGGIIAIDNVLWSGNVVNPAPNDLTSQALDALNKKLHKDQRIELSMLTVGDGLSIVIKR
ncbi:catechol O-methyltransferase domain-containing protein 1-like isoform X1 [Anoplopoma fimbria]|uniref:catechol O-methyltransferase domain-containing protein 1-like isoform X1 n=1 Tax=Anoplopoma fimbria TaxID=229290 RepID=UPI0023EB0A77|nr:catechol O-methyltransferase domain-containing protein 1-like isoform X1 [Anoplopoma fimbria]